MKKKKSKKKTSFISKTAMTVLTIILIILFFCIMSMVEKIQGTARVVNYAGLVRGKTQRIIKLEDAGEPQDTMIADINAYIDGLQNGSSELDLVRLDDRDFQDKMTELASYFEELKAEILLVREKGYENTAIIEKSETFFKICDEATGLAEAYSQRMASSLKKLEQVVVGDIIGLVFVIGMELIKAVRYAAMNRILQKKVYLDEATACQIKINAKRFWRKATEEKKFPARMRSACLTSTICARSTTVWVTTRETNISVPLPFSFEKQSRRSISSEETAEMSFLPFCAD